jgi:hypothetical protein
MSSPDRREPPIPTVSISNSEPSVQASAAEINSAGQPNISGRTEVRGARRVGRTVGLVVAGAIAVGCGCREIGNLITAGIPNARVEPGALPAPFGEDVMMAFGSPADKMHILDDRLQDVGDCWIDGTEENDTVRPLWQVFEDFNSGNQARLMEYVNATGYFSEAQRNKIRMNIQNNFRPAYDGMLQSLRNEPRSEIHKYLRIDAFAALIQKDLPQEPGTWRKISQLKDVLYQEADNQNIWTFIKNGFKSVTEYEVFPQGLTCNYNYNHGRRLGSVDMTTWRENNPKPPEATVIGNRKARKVVPVAEKIS